METIKETEWADDSRNYSPYGINSERPDPDDAPDEDENWSEDEDIEEPDNDDWDEDSEEELHIDHTNNPSVNPDFTSRPDGRTREPLGPGHEPGV